MRSRGLRRRSFKRTPRARAFSARVEADLKITSTTGARINGLIHEAERLRRAYGVPTGFQRGPFFEIQTDRFALLAIDTGILKTVDPGQDAWLEAALARAAGKFTMAILGHPFYAGGHDETALNESFARLKQRLLSHGVSIAMAGDTHDLEYYADPAPPGGSAVHYFVNGGGGAYLSFGTALDWPDATTDGQLGALSQPRRRDREDRERARHGGSGRRGGGHTDSGPGRFRPSGSRPRSTTTSRRSFRASSSSGSSHPPIVSA